MLGSHLSIAGGLFNALLEAERLKMDTVQIFTKNQRQWQSKPLSQTEIEAWLKELHRLNWSKTVSHASYLINMGSPDTDLRTKSVTAMIDEIERCEILEIPFLVVHPGSHKGEGTKTGINLICKSLNEIIRHTSGYETLICLETTAGSGNQLGGDFEHISSIREKVKITERVAACFDTCHVTAAGYDMSTSTKAKKVFAEFDNIIGLDNLVCFHLNDSKEPIGSKKDRHEHIGDGYVGRAAFEFIVNERRFQQCPMILETKKGTTDKGTAWDTVNLRRLSKLVHS